MGLFDFFKRKYDITKVSGQKSKIDNFLKKNCYVEIDELFKRGFEENGKAEYGEIKLIKEERIGDITEKIIFKNTNLFSYYFQKDGKNNGWYCRLSIRDFGENYGVKGIVYGLTEGLFVNDQEEGEWRECLFFEGKRYKVEEISNYKNGELDGFEETYNSFSNRTLKQDPLVFKTQYSRGKKHGPSIQYATYSPLSGNKGGFPVDIKYWEEGEFKYGTKYSPLDGTKLDDYFELDS